MPSWHLLQSPLTCPLCACVNSCLHTPRNSCHHATFVRILPPYSAWASIAIQPCVSHRCPLQFLPSYPIGAHCNPSSCAPLASVAIRPCMLRLLQFPLTYRCHSPLQSITGCRVVTPCNSCP